MSSIASSTTTPVVAATGVESTNNTTSSSSSTSNRLKNVKRQHISLQQPTLKKMHLYFLEELSKIEDTSKLTGQLGQFIKSYNFNIDSKTPINLLKELASNELLSMTTKKRVQTTAKPKL